MTNLVIDIGNTFTKIALFKGDELVKAEQHPSIATQPAEGFFAQYAIDSIIASSVKKENEPWLAALEEQLPVTYFNSSIVAGIISHYKTPLTLGTDRLAAVIGANYLYPERNNIVIGGGTCITYDCVDAGANYFGGSISPGLKMRYNALNYYTAALPVVQPDPDFDAAYGDDTRSAILSGVQNGIKYELLGFIDNYVKMQNEYNIILSGGDSIFFDTLLKNSIFAPYIKIEPYLVLKGLNAAITKA